MALVYAINADNKFNEGIKVASSVGYGRRRTINDIFLADATADGDDIVIGRVTESTVIQPQGSITHNDLGLDVTLQLGLVNITDGTFTAVSVATDAATGGVIRFDEEADINSFPHVVLRSQIGEFNSEAWLVIRVAGAAATGIVKPSIDMTVD